MAVPKKKTSRSVRNMRRSHHGLTFTAAVEFCPNCSELKRRHQVCQACGQYRGNQIGPVPPAPPVDEGGGDEAVAAD